MLYVIQCAADTFQGSPDISIGIFTKNLLQSHQYRIQRDHYRLGFLLQGFQLFVQLFHDTQFQFRSQGIPALGISRCISGDEVDGFRAHQVGATDSSNGIGRYLQFFSHGKLYQYLIVPFTGKLYGTDLSDTISPIDYTTGNFQSIHPVINTIKHIIPVEQCFRFQKINSPDQYNNSSNCC